MGRALGDNGRVRNWDPWSILAMRIGAPSWQSWSIAKCWQRLDLICTPQ